MSEKEREQSEIVKAAQGWSGRDVTSVYDGILRNIHGADQCAGHHCWVHNPSDHHMQSWPVRWREDKATAERVCDHGVGHPDPDDLAYQFRLGRDLSVHGCDGCCGPAPSVRSWRLGESVQALEEGMIGRWLVTTYGSQHVWDLAEMTFTRFPGAHSPSGAMDFDGQPMPITHVRAWPRVGSRSWVFYDDARAPHLIEQYRISSVIRRIERLLEAGDE